MKIIEGELPEGRLWRTLVLLLPGQEPALAWQLGLQLANASSGETVAALILPSALAEDALQRARNSLNSARDCTPDDQLKSTYFLLVEALDFRQALLRLIDRVNIDLLLLDGEGPEWHDLGQVPVPVAVTRGVAYRDYRNTAADREAGEPQPPIKRILVPTAGGPNTALALGLLLPLTPKVEVTALYVVPSYLGEGEEAHGHARLRQLFNFADAGDRIERKVIQAESVTHGIVQEASGPYDLVILGATRQSSFDRVLFGDVVSAVVRESKTPVVVIREASSTLGSIARNLAWRMQRVIPRLGLSERMDVYVRIRRSARPNTEFFVLIGLSALIAALGLLLSSPAVVIGAMLVAPLMTPMLGAGMAIVLGNPRFLRLTVGAVVKGMLLALVLSFLSGFLRPGQPLTPEILARTEPTLLDLGIALFAGMAGAYALAHSEAAAALPGVAISAALVPPLGAAGIAFATAHFEEGLGALLLFLTNLTAIVAAAILVFVILGFRPAREQKERRSMQQRSLRVAIILLAAITVVLGVTTYRLAQEAALSSRIDEVTEQLTNELAGVEFSAVEKENISNPEQPLTLDVTVRSTRALLYTEVETLRDQIGGELQPYLGSDRELALNVTVIRVTRLDPEVPPTATPTPLGIVTATGRKMATVTPVAVELTPNE